MASISIPTALGAASLATTVGGTVAGAMAGGDTPGIPTPNIYQYGGMPGMDTQAQNLINQQAAINPYAQNSQQYQDVLNQTYNNPYAQQAQLGAQAGGQALTGVGQSMLGAAGQYGQFTAGAMPAAQQMLNTAFDPQNALFNQQQQRLQDQVRASNAAAGIGTSPVGAGLENQAMSNFDIAWQQQQLANQNAGLTGYNNAITNVGRGLDVTGQMGTSGATALQTGAGMPYAASIGQLGAQQSALGNYAGAMGAGQSGLMQGPIGNSLSYLDQGVGAQSKQYNQQMQAYNAQLAAQQAQQQGIGQLMSSATGFLNNPNTANLFGGGGGGGVTNSNGAGVTNSNMFSSTGLFGSQGPWSSNPGTVLDTTGFSSQPGVSAFLSGFSGS